MNVFVVGVKTAGSISNPMLQILAFGFELYPLYFAVAQLFGGLLHPTHVSLVDGVDLPSEGLCLGELFVKVLLILLGFV